MALLSAAELKTKKIVELNDLAKSLGIEGYADMRKQELIFRILESDASKLQTTVAPSNGKVVVEEESSAPTSGTLELHPDGYGFLRSPDYNYLPSPDDVYVSPSQVQKLKLRTGDTIEGTVRPPKTGERFFALSKLDKLNYMPVEMMRD